MILHIDKKPETCPESKEEETRLRGGWCQAALRARCDRRLKGPQQTVAPARVATAEHWERGVFDCPLIGPGLWTDTGTARPGTSA